MFSELFCFVCHTCLRAGGAIERLVQIKMDVRFKKNRKYIVDMQIYQFFLFFLRQLLFVVDNNIVWRPQFFIVMYCTYTFICTFHTESMWVVCYLCDILLVVEHSDTAAAFWHTMQAAVVGEIDATFYRCVTPELNSNSFVFSLKLILVWMQMSVSKDNLWISSRWNFIFAFKYLETVNNE